jgi:hypothetical protein
MELDIACKFFFQVSQIPQDKFPVPLTRSIKVKGMDA